MTLDQRTRAARAFWEDPEATDDQVQAALLIAQQKKFRPKTVIGLDVDRKARHLATLGGLPDAMAARALIVYHLAEQRPMMGAFLDALGIEHENGLIQEDSGQAGRREDRPRRRAARAAVSARRCADLSEDAAVAGSGDVGRAGGDRCRVCSWRSRSPSEPVQRLLPQSAPRPCPRASGSSTSNVVPCVRRGRERHRPARLLRDAVDDRQAEAGPFRRLLRREERLEDVRLHVGRIPSPVSVTAMPREGAVGDAGIAQHGALVEVTRSTLHVDRAAVRHRVARVDDQVHQHLFELPGLDPHERRRRRRADDSSRHVGRRPAAASCCRARATTTFRSISCASSICLRLNASSCRVSAAPRSAALRISCASSYARIVRLQAQRASDRCSR